VLMDKLKLHITLLLSFLFFLAQGLQTLHYLVIEHDYSIAEASIGKNISEKNNAHNCDHKIHKNQVYPIVFSEKAQQKNTGVSTDNTFDYNEPLNEFSQELPKLRGPPRSFFTTKKTS
jgi:hypothetical protein